MANQRGRSLHFAWWAIGYGTIGFLIAATILITRPRTSETGPAFLNNLVPVAGWLIGALILIFVISGAAIFSADAGAWLRP